MPGKDAGIRAFGILPQIGAEVIEAVKTEHDAYPRGHPLCNPWQQDGRNQKKEAARESEQEIDASQRRVEDRHPDGKAAETGKQNPLQQGPQTDVDENGAQERGTDVTGRGDDRKNTAPALCVAGFVPVDADFKDLAPGTDCRGRVAHFVNLDHKDPERFDVGRVPERESDNGADDRGPEMFEGIQHFR